MADHEQTEPEERAEPADATPTPVAPRRSSGLWRGLRWLGLVLVACAVGTIVALLFVDLGPRVKPIAESQASRLINRPVRIGYLSMSPLRGRFVFDDLTIQNVDPARSPFFHARRIVVTMPWWTILLRREVFIESVVVSDWRMLIEAYAQGGHNFIRIPRPGPGPKRFVTTVQLVRAERGEFEYQDYRTPWHIVARDADITVAKLRDYRGEVRTRNGTVQIQRYEPMWLNGYGTFSIVGGKVVLDRVDFDSDGARSVATGAVDVGAWPEQSYQVKSELDFSRMRELFFKGYDFSLSGTGQFQGSFHLFKGGRKLAGDFASAEAGLNDWRFPRLKGKVLWTADRLEVTETTSDFYGGALRLTYTMKPFGAAQPTIARLDTSYEGVELARLTDFLARPSLRLAGLASGRTRLEFPLGRFREHRGDGELRVTPPDGVDLMTRTLPADAAAWPGPPVGPFNPEALLGYLPVGGTVAYRYGPEWVELSPSEMATAQTFVTFEGRTRYGDDSTFPFHVTSRDWQESDRVLAAIISAFGQPTRAVPVGGSGEFDGVMSGSFTRPLVTGRFNADRVWAWNVNWGRASGDVTIFNAYVDVKDGRLRAGTAEASAEGRFSLGYPRRDGGEEFDARVQLRDWPIADLRQAFELYDYPVDGLVSGEFHLWDRYTGPQGFGRATFRDILAYGERFETGQSGMRFEGTGVRLDAFEVRKRGGDITGAAFVGWDGTYSFNATGRRIPVEHVAALTFPAAPLTGQLQFTAAGSGVFLSPRYEVKLRVDDLFLRDEGIGQVTGRLLVRDDVVTLDQFEVASARLAVSGRGRVALTEEADGEFELRFQETSLDPYVRVLQPQLSPFTTAVASGTLRVFGELRNPERVQGEVVVDRLALNLFDYRLRNDGDLRFSLDNQVVHVERLKLVGDGTSVEMAGEVRLAEETIALRALGDANLGILQGFLRDIRSSGAAELQADIRGRLDAPTVLGTLVISDGRLRHFALPHAFEAINGRVDFDAAGLRIDDLSGRLGGGPVRVSGRLGFRGFTPTEYNLTAVGEGLRLRYPEGVRSLIDTTLTLRGDFFNPLLGGTVTVRSATLERTFDTGGTGLFGFAAGGGAGPPSPPVPSRIPVRFDVRLLAPASLRVENRDARLVSSAELTLRGTYDQPVLFGRVEIDRGEVLFEGNRFQVTRGTVDFVNPTRIEPLFDVEAETQARVPGQIYRVVTRVTGTPTRFSFGLSSDPPLPTVEILSLLFGQVRDPQNAEMRALRSPQLAEQELIKARAARLLASPIASEVGRVVEETFRVDTVQITPLLSDMSAQESSRITPSARLTVGKRISNRVYLTYSRALNASTRDEIILLEFNQSDRLAWIISQNEDRTYAVDVRVRRVF